MKTTIRLSLSLASMLLSGSLLAQATEPRALLPKPKSYGTDQISYYRVAASEFTLLDTTSGVVYTDTAYPTANNYERYSVGVPGWFVASPHLPSGAVVTYFELDSCDEDPVNDVVAYLSQCDILGHCNGLIGMQSVNNAIPCGFTSLDVSSNGLQVDNYRNQLTITVITQSGTSNTRFAGVILGYKLQVSPPPLFADFNDVPTDHPYFQFIEALSNSGITAGCGNGDYCPDRAITRGEMAVFLAKALGLQWP
jgi:hypothetical protein